MVRLGVLFVAAVMLQGQQYTHLSGLIRDPVDAAVPEASIQIVNEETGFRRTTTTRPDGGYVIAALHPGLYKITVRKEGFRTLVRFGVKLDVAQPARVDFTLSLGSMQETITVEGTPPLIPSEDASVGTLVSRDHMERLPINGRGILSLIELAPGSVVTPATRGESGQFTANGQRPNAHYFTVDGVSANSGVSGGGSAAQTTGGALPGMTALGSMHNLVPLEALDEFRLQTSTTNPEFGRLPGAQVAMSSRSGSNEFHGSLFQYFRHERLDANDWFANRVGERRAPLRMNDFGASLSGPVKRNRTFFFGTYEGMRLRQPFAWRSPSPTAEARVQGPVWVQRLLQLYPMPTGDPLAEGLAEFTGRNNRPARLDTLSLRLDHALTGNVSLFGRFFESPSSNRFGNVQISELNMRSRGFTMGTNWRVTPRLIADIRWNYSHASADSQWSPADPSAYPACYIEPVTQAFFFRNGLCDELVRVSIAGTGSLALGQESLRRQSQWNVIPTAVFSLGSHQLRGGMDWRRLSPQRQDRAGSISVLAEGLADLIAVRNLWIAIAPPQVSRSTVEEYSAFLQDTWRIHPRLTATFGMRWEFSPAPSFFLEETGGQDRSTGVNFDPKQAVWRTRYRYFAPRVGVSFSPAASGKTVLRGGYGMFYSSSLSVATDLVNGGPFSLSQFTSGRNGIFSTLLSYGFANDLELPRVQQWSGSVEHIFGARDVVSVAYTGSRGRGLLRREIGGPGSTDVFQLALVSNHSRSDYHSMQLQYRRRLSQGFQALAGYSWAHSIDDGSSDSALFWVGSGLTPAMDRANSDFDVRHSFNAALNFEFGKGTKWLEGWSVDGMMRARTGFPLTLLNAEHSIGIAFSNIFRPDRVGGQPLWINDRNTPGGRRLNPEAFVQVPRQGNLGRNAIMGFGMSQVDLAVRRDWRFTEKRALQFRAEGFNLFNQTNFADPVRFLSNPLFGQSTSLLNLMLGTGSPGSGLTPILQTGGPRSVQLVLRFRF
ncbi:MAG: TonB-dependent receptor [Bryobacterales bacterium]|nr:TonB-dependent receptor [Bryobacterales bacterium]